VNVEVVLLLKVVYLLIKDYYVVGCCDYDVDCSYDDKFENLFVERKKNWKNGVYKILKKNFCFYKNLFKLIPPALVVLSKESYCEKELLLLFNVVR
jgi:hypothetical protein